MALSGSFSGNILDGGYTLRVDWSAVQNIANNTSKITATMYLITKSGWPLDINTRSDNFTTIAGTNYTWSSPAIDNGGGKTTKLNTVTSGNISHNADGTKSVTISATFYIRFTRKKTGVYYEKITASQTITLNTIPRATQPTLSASSVNMGSKVTISMPRASSSFTHDLAYSFAGASYVSIGTGKGTSYEWEVPDLASKIPNAASGTVTIRCITKNGSTTIGTKTVLLTAKVPTTSDFMPSISSVTTAEQTSGLAAQFGAYIQNKSKIKATITAAGAKGSTIKSYVTTFAGKAYSGSSWTSGVITQSGSLSLMTIVTDTRGRTATKTTTISVLAYNKPTISAFTARRATQAGVEDPTNGTHVALAYTYAVQSLNSKNTASFKVEIKGINETSWQTILTGSSLSAKVTTPAVVEDYQISTDNSYDLRATLSDWFGAKATFLAGIQSGAVILDLLADGKGISFGKSAEHSGFAEFGLKIMAHNGETPEGALPLKTNDNLNDYTTPGFYVFSSAVGATVANMPIGGSGSGSVQVVREGEANQVRQVVTRCSAASREIWERLYYSNTWQGWQCIYKGGTGRVLWTGGYYMTESHTVDLSEPVSKQPSGIVLVFSRYADGESKNYGFTNHFVSKEFVRMHPNTWSYFLIMTSTFDLAACKYLNISDTQIKGYASNNQTGAGATGITYTNSAYVLRYVIGV